MQLDRRYEQAITRPTPHDELVQIHFLTEEAWFFADLTGQGDDQACAARRQTRSPCGVFGCGDSFLPDDQASNVLEGYDTMLEKAEPDFRATVMRYRQNPAENSLTFALLIFTNGT